MKANTSIHFFPNCLETTFICICVINVVFSLKYCYNNTGAFKWTFSNQICHFLDFALVKISLLIFSQILNPTVRFQYFITNLRQIISASGDWNQFDRNCDCVWILINITENVLNVCIQILNNIILKLKWNSCGWLLLWV